MASVITRLKTVRTNTRQIRVRLFPSPVWKGGRRGGPAAHSRYSLRSVIAFPFAGERRRNFFHPGPIPPEVNHDERGQGGEKEFHFAVHFFHDVLLFVVCSRAVTALHLLKRLSTALGDRNLAATLKIAVLLRQPKVTTLGRQ